MQKLIYGKGIINRIVSVEVKDDVATIFRELENGSIEQIERPHRFWVLFANDLSDKFTRMEGDLHYKYMVEYDTFKRWNEVCRNARTKGYDHWCIKNHKEQYLVRQGETYFKDLKVEDVSVLSFDIETTGLTHDDGSKVLLISNTYRNRGEIQKKLFAYDDFESQKEMINSWCSWVRDVNPSILVGHNLYGFDFPYLSYCAKKEGTTLKLGRDGSTIKTSSYTSLFRKDGSQSYDYNNISVYGREIVDTFFLSLKYDVQRNYPSYGLKAIIEYEGLERKNRQHYDASTINKSYTDPVEWKKIKRYAIDDADDSLALYDLMIPSFFYYTQSIPRSLQSIINTATGSQINAFMVRSYLQDNHSLPQASQAERYQGAISFGNPGIYKHVYKVDVASLYPSIILQYNICDKNKDPKLNLLKTTKYFTEERLNNKQMAKETGSRHFQDLERSQKIMINSIYGFLGANNLLFNSPRMAARITQVGRAILNRGLQWVKDSGYQIVNADTDSFSYTNGIKQTNSTYYAQILEINSLYSPGIRWEDDGVYNKVIVVKTKNYVLQDEKGNFKIKGSGLKGTMKEPALKRFINEIITALLEGKPNDLNTIYLSYIRSINIISDSTIVDWASKKTITKSVLNPERTTEQRIKDAIGDRIVSEGDKIKVFFRKDNDIALVEDFDGQYDKDRLYEKLYRTIKIFETIIDIKQFVNFKLKRSKKILARVLNEETK